MPGSKFYGLRFGDGHNDTADLSIFPRTGLPARRMTMGEYERMAPIVVVETEPEEPPTTMDQLVASLGGKIVAEVTPDGAEVFDGSSLEEIDLLEHYLRDQGTT